MAVAVQVAICLVIFGLHHWTALIVLRGDYTPFSAGDSVSSVVWDESQHYAPGPRRFMQTGRLPSEMDVVELENKLNAYTMLHSVVIGGIGYLLGSLEAAWILLDSILPAGLWLLLYWILGHYTPSTLVRSAGTWITMLVPFGPRNAMLLSDHAWIQPLELTRMPHPALSYLLLLGAAALTARAAAAGGWRRILLAGVTSGLLFYTYYFYWLAGFMALAIWFAAALLMRSRASPRVFAVATVGTVVGAAYIALVLRAMAQGSPHDLMARVGVFHREISVSAVFVLAATTILLLGLVRRTRVAASSGAIDMPVMLATSVTALVVAAALGRNFHLLSGYDPQHAHFWNRLIQPAMALLLFMAFARLAQRATGHRGTLVHGALLVFTLLCVGMGVCRQVSVGLKTNEDHRSSTERMVVLRWLRDHVPQDRVVGCLDARVTTLIPTVCGHWNFVPIGARSMATDHEILVRYLLAAHWEGEDPQQVRDDLTAPPPDSDRRWSGAVYRHWLTRWLRPELAGELDELMEQLDLPREMRDRRLDFIVLPPHRSLERISDLFPGSHVVHDNHGWRVIDVQSRSSDRAAG
jgi:hypothetical protein